jgi:hypothetical protein
VVPNGATNPGNTPTIVASVAGNYTVVAVNASNPNCPSNPSTSVVTVNPLPNVTAGADGSICSGDTLVLTAMGAFQYAWDNGVLNNTPFVPNATATYTVTGVDANGCMATDAVTISVLNSSSSTVNQTAIDSYTLNGQTYTQSGVYTQTIPAANGCDSIITLNLMLSFTGLHDLNPNAKTLVKITDVNGRIINRRKNTMMLFIYSDGTIERVMEFGE